MFGLLQDILNRTALQPEAGCITPQFGAQKALRVESVYRWGAAQTAVTGVAEGRLRTGRNVLLPGVGCVRVNYVSSERGPVESVRPGQRVDVKLIGIEPQQIQIGTVLFCI